VKIRAVKDHEFYERFADSEIEALDALLAAKEFQPGQLMIEEGASTNELFLLEEGTAEVVKTSQGKEYRLAEISEGELVGEMSLLDDSERSTSVRAQGRVRSQMLRREDLDTLGGDLGYLKYKFPLYLSKVVLERLRESNERHVQEVDLRNRFGKLTLLIIVAMALLTCLAGFADTLLGIFPVYWIAPISALLLLFLCYLTVKVTGEPLSFFGLTTRNWKKSLIEAALVSAVLVAGFNVLFSLNALVGAFRELYTTYLGALYLSVAFAQEVITRGFLLTALVRFYEDDKGFTSILTASLIFAVSHVHLGFTVLILTFLMGVLLGFVYLRHRTLIGVTIIHFVLGYMGAALGLLDPS
jgi:membrane protease YdiL (CAAX protease family)